MSYRPLDRMRGLVERLAPWRTAAVRHASSALQLAAGASAARGIWFGAWLGLVTVADHAKFGKPISVPDTQCGRLGDHAPLKVATRRADPIHVLLVGNDRRYRAVASVLLARRGCTVTAAERMADASRVAKREAADVVVIDAGSSMAEAAREAARVRIITGSVGVVLVADERDEDVSGTPVLSKWGPFGELVGAIKNACPHGPR